MHRSGSPRYQPKVLGGGGSRGTSEAKEKNPDCVGCGDSELNRDLELNDRKPFVGFHLMDAAEFHALVRLPKHNLR